MFYIAYGSNMSRERMRNRCPEAKFVKVAMLRGYKLTFKGVDGDAKATLIKDADFNTPVVIWEFSEEDERIMDRYEGFPFSYGKRHIQLSVRGKKESCLIYIKDLECPIARPSRRYVNVIRQGYKDFNVAENVLDSYLELNSSEFYNEDKSELPLVSKKYSAKDISKYTKLKEVLLGA